MHTKTKIFSALGVLFLMAQLHAAIAEPRYLSFNDDFVWYVAGRLATQIGTVTNSSDVKLDVADTAQFRSDWSLLYHHALIECKGPLQEINKTIVGYEIPNPNEGKMASPLAYVGAVDDVIWPIVTNWEVSVRKHLMEKFRSGDFSTDFPNCVVPEYRAQNPFF